MSNMATKNQKSYCIICGKQADGIEIKIDNVIKTIRYLKKTIFKTEKNNRLVVSKECYPLYIKNRKRYVSRQRLYITLGIVFVIFSIFISPTIQTIILSVSVLIFLYLISLLNYTPDLIITNETSHTTILENAATRLQKQKHKQ